MESDRIAERLTTMENKLDALAAAVQKNSRTRDERVILMVDHTNLFFTVKNRYRLDYNKLRKLVVGDRIELDARFYYSEEPVDRLDEIGRKKRNNREKFYYFLKSQGWNLIELPRIRRGTYSEEKGLDAQIILDACKIGQAGKVDTVVLVSGDGDYCNLIHNLRTDHYTRVEVAFFQPSTSIDLIQSANKFTDLTTMIEHIKREDDLPEEYEPSAV